MNEATQAITAVRRINFAEQLAQGVNQREAYRAAFGDNQSDKSADIQASRLLKTPEVVQTLEEIKAQFLKDVPEAYAVLKSIMLDDKAPANVRSTNAKTIIELGGAGAAQKIEQTNTTYKAIEFSESEEEEIKRLFQNKAWSKPA